MLVAFGVHIGDIGKRPHPKMAVWIPQLNSALADGGSKARIVSFFGKTGNFVVDAPESEAATIRGLLTSVARTPFAVLDPAVVRRCVGALEGVEKPRDEEGCTWGLGASFCTRLRPQRLIRTVGIQRRVGSVRSKQASWRSGSARILLIVKCSIAQTGSRGASPARRPVVASAERGPQGPLVQSTESSGKSLPHNPRLERTGARPARFGRASVAAGRSTCVSSRQESHRKGGFLNVRNP